MAAKNIRVNVADLVAPSEWAAASPAVRRAAIVRLGELALVVKRDEITRGVGVDGRQLRPVKPKSRPDGATGKPLDPHYAESRTIRLMAVHVDEKGVTLFWRADGSRGSWAKILGYHADGLVRGAPARNVIGFSPAGRRKLEDRFRSYWRNVTGRRRSAPVRKAKAVVAAPVPAPAPVPPRPKSTGRVVYLAPGEKPKLRSNKIQVYEEPARRPRKPVPPPVPKPPNPAPAPKAKPPKPAVAELRTPPSPPEAPLLPTIQSAVEYAQRHGIKIEPRGFAAIAQANKDAADIPAVYRASTKTIYVNEQHSYWSDPKPFMELSHQKQWFSSAAVDHIIVHESGHALHDRAVGDEVYQKIRKLSFKPEHVALIKSEVSRYAAAKPVEFVAETFAALREGRTFSDAVMSLYRKLGGPMP